MVPDAGDKNPTGGVRGTRHRLRGPSRIDVHGASPAKAGRAKSVFRKAAPRKKRVLFVCIGNSCRSQMAEAFAKAYGADIMEAESAGVNAATFIAPLTRQTLAERNLSIEESFPKNIDQLRSQSFDLVVNMSGMPVQLAGARLLEWTVPDPIGQTESYYQTVAAQIEGLVMRLILELRQTA